MLRQLYESFIFAFTALKSNLLRTTLSLLGVTVGIFLIIAVYTLVDSLERNIKDSFSFLGAGVVYVQKWPFVGGPDFPWWEYIKRPQATYQEYELLRDNLKNQNGVAIITDIRGRTFKHGSNSMGTVILTGGTFDYYKLLDTPIEDGRYFSMQEVEGGRPVAIIGKTVANSLFPNESPIGKEIKHRGYKFKVIGLMEKAGESILGIESNDDKVVIPFKAFQKLYLTGSKYNGIEAAIGISGLEEDTDLNQLTAEIKGVLRPARGLRPGEKDDFSINKPEAIADAVSGVFVVFNTAGTIIGLCAILIGGFGIANIMFVTVKERTPLIGIQKSLGAKNYFILSQFLFESLLLSLIGGFAGILLVYLLTFVPLGSLQIILTAKNVIIGVIIASLTGVLSGLIPAAKAANLDPVIAIRS
ncbi:ABC transporter permease [Marinigracilibium pacificum]|uniref:FtsX-like permease family protein n=1 Tax=Marinigracilibium pacificum TaxID=2729599 RepID=A0A848J514_9BACT|nr:ABC transporter permease [Marinigracilibium pacificum]NMM49554.1 FtsX-like permease family protein [Marinigracilibium pacificum]